MSVVYFELSLNKLNPKSIPILYEDDNLLVVNKPAGLMVHGDGKNTDPTLADWILEKYPSTKDVGESSENLKVLGHTLKIPPRPGIVHRLDRETSGAMVIAKDQPTYLFLKRQFKAHKISKVYNLFVNGLVKKEDGMIDKPIGRGVASPNLKSASPNARGILREALTYYRTIARGGGFTFLEARPRTGRTHQIRVHFKEIGHPVLGDKLYAPKLSYGLGFERLALHARSLTFRAPSGKEIVIEAPYPKDFERAIAVISK